MSTPLVNLAALVEPKRLLIGVANTTHSWAMPESFRRTTMTYPKLPSTIASRQMNLLFDAKRSEAMSHAERNRVVLILIQILVQAAGVNIEELEGDRL
jgi:hypothetical protein